MSAWDLFRPASLKPNCRDMGSTISGGAFADRFADPSPQNIVSVHGPEARTRVVCKGLASQSLVFRLWTKPKRRRAMNQLSNNVIDLARYRAGERRRAWPDRI